MIAFVIKKVLDTMCCASKHYDSSHGPLHNWLRNYQTFDITNPHFEFEMLIDQSIVKKVRQIVQCTWTKAHEHQSTLCLHMGLCVEGELEEGSNRRERYWLMVLLDEEWRGTQNPYQYEDDSTHTHTRSLTAKLYDFDPESLQMEVKVEVELNHDKILKKLHIHDGYDERAEKELLQELRSLEMM